MQKPHSFYDDGSASALHCTSPVNLNCNSGHNNRVLLLLIIHLACELVFCVLRHVSLRIPCHASRAPNFSYLLLLLVLRIGIESLAGARRRKSINKVQNKSCRVEQKKKKKLCNEYSNELELRGRNCKLTAKKKEKTETKWLDQSNECNIQANVVPNEI